MPPTMLSGLSSAAGLVLAPKAEGALKHIEFVPLASGRALVVLVSSEGQVENRVIDIPPGVPPSTLQEASNYLNARLQGRTLAGLPDRKWRPRSRATATRSMSLPPASSKPVSPPGAAKGRGGNLIVRGQGRLLADVTQIEKLASIQTLFERLEAQETMLRLLELAETSDGVRIFIGAESGLFGSAGVSMIVAPARNAEQPDRRRDRRDRADPHQLRPRHPCRRLHRAGRGAFAGLARSSAGKMSPIRSN